MVRRSSSFNTRAHRPHLRRHRARATATSATAPSLNQLMRTIRPDEVYNLGAQSHVRVSFDIPEYTADVDRARHAAPARRDPRGRRAAAASTRRRRARCSARSREVPQTEETPFHPRSPYGVGEGLRLLDHAQLPRGVRHVRGQRDPLQPRVAAARRRRFVTRKITRRGRRDPARRAGASCSSATSTRSATGATRRDYMDGAWRMLQQDEPDDYVLATGETHSVQEFLEEAFGYAGLDWRDYVKIDARYFRPAEVDLLIGDYSKAKAKLGWEPTVRFDELVRMMVDATASASSKSTTVAARRREARARPRAHGGRGARRARRARARQRPLPHELLEHEGLRRVRLPARGRAGAHLPRGVGRGRGAHGVDVGRALRPRLRRGRSAAGRSRARSTPRSTRRAATAASASSSRSARRRPTAWSASRRRSRRRGSTRSPTRPTRRRCSRARA